MFQVVNINGDTDLYPPERVTNLKVTALDKEKKLILVKFTATGDDLDSGTGTLTILKIPLYTQKYFRTVSKKFFIHSQKL